MAEQPVDKKARYSELMRVLLEPDVKKLELRADERKRIEEEIRTLGETIPPEEREILERGVREEFAADIQEEK